MTKYDPHAVVREVIDAHGGAERWGSLEALDAEISVSGFLFKVKRRPVMSHVHVRASTREPHFTFFDYPRPGQNGELIGNDQVRIVGIGGNVVASRDNPRSAFGGMRRQLSWDDLDFIYFGGYATWNYLVTPFLFLREGFSFDVIDPAGSSHPDWIRLETIFPDDVPTHCRKQIYYYDDHCLLRRLDYTAEVVSRWARAAHICEGYRNFDGLKAPTRRRVLPLFWGNNPLPGPTLVALEIHDIRQVRVSRSAGEM